MQTQWDLDEELKEALEAVVDLRAHLQLAYFARDEVDVNQVEASLNAGASLLRKHGCSDDMMDVDNDD
jgi:hypothetical protein